MTITKKIEIAKFNPCSEAVEFREKFKTFEESWQNCPRGDWMLWIAQRLKVDKRILTLAKGKCVETVLHLMKDDRSKAAVKAAIDYGNGLIDGDQLSAAAYDAAAADDAAAYDAYAAYAAYAAAYDDAAADDAAAYDAYAAYAAYAAAYDDAAAADDAAAYDAYAAADDAYAAADDARKRNQLATADICREILTETIFEKLEL